ncbi:MAG TPA: DUF488 domain-containing protein [Solirubrobacterales bacterium]|nr:DUF488 domain-containing protein [Solirubrobacterales bacterium]
MSEPAKVGEVFTIGHSNHSREHFLNLLCDREIEVLVDVRSHPRSRYVEWADRTNLASSVKGVGIKYLFLGEELGGRPNAPQFYDAEGRALYWKIAEGEAFEAGVRRLQEGAERYRVAIMCSEENPASCHRRLLVAKVLLERGFKITHIRGNGACESERQPIDFAAGSLFADEENLWRSSLSVSPARPRKTSLAA